MMITLPFRGVIGTTLVMLGMCRLQWRSVLTLALLLVEVACGGDTNRQTVVYWSPTGQYALFLTSEYSAAPSWRQTDPLSPKGRFRTRAYLTEGSLQKTPVQIVDAASPYFNFYFSWDGKLLYCATENVGVGDCLLMEYRLGEGEKPTSIRSIGTSFPIFFVGTLDGSLLAMMESDLGNLSYIVPEGRGSLLATAASPTPLYAFRRNGAQGACDDGSEAWFTTREQILSQGDIPRLAETSVLWRIPLENSNTTLDAISTNTLDSDCIWVSAGGRVEIRQEPIPAKDGGCPDGLRNTILVSSSPVATDLHIRQLRWDRSAVVWISPSDSSLVVVSDSRSATQVLDTVPENTKSIAGFNEDLGLVVCECSGSLDVLSIDTGMQRSLALPDP